MITFDEIKQNASSNMEQTSKMHISVIKHILYLLYPKYNSYIFIIHLVAKYIAEVNRNMRYGRMNFHRKGLIAKALPKKLHEYIGRKAMKTDFINGGHQIIVPLNIFNDLYSENIYYRDQGSLWVNMNIFIKIPYEPWMKNKQCFANKIKRIISNDILTINQLAKSDEMNFVETTQVIERIVQLIPADIHSNVAYAEETEVFNWLTPFIYRDFAMKDLVLKFSPIKNKNFAPKIAETIVVQMINTTKVIGTDLLYVLLEQYFRTPKFLHENDFFEIPLTELYMKHLYCQYERVAYFNQSIFFKCKTIKGCKSTSMGYFVVKGETEILQEQNANLFVPSKKLLTLNIAINNSIEYSFIQKCPYGLLKNIAVLQKAILPFLFDKQASWIQNELKCILKPIFSMKGNPGVGCELLLSLLAKQNGMNFVQTQCRQLCSSTTAKQTEAKIESLFQNAKSYAPVLIYLENFEEFGVDAENNEDVRIVESFTTKLNELFENFTKLPIIIFAGYQVNIDLKPNIRRLFLDDFEIKNPSKEERFDILKWIVLSQNIVLCDDISKELNDEESLNIANANSTSKENNDILDIEISDNEKWELNPKFLAVLYKIASKTETFVYEDLDSLVKMALQNYGLAKINLCKSIGIKCSKNFVRENDFDVAIDNLRGMQCEKLAALKIPKIQWESVGGLDELKKEIYRTIELPLKLPHLMSSSGLKRSGILLWGPPGCGKTLVARAIASQLNANFLSVKGPELLDMYVGQSEKNMRDIFSSARSSAPCVIFFDEAEAAAGARGASGDSGGAADRLVSQLLAELDGVSAQQINSESDAVIVIAATNRPDLVEPALLRPGRLDKLLYVGPYNGHDEKIRVLQASCRECNIAEDVDLHWVSTTLPKKCSGADLAAVVNRARHNAISRIIHHVEYGKVDASMMSEKDVLLTKDDFQKALMDFSPSISGDEMIYYESLKSKLC